MAGASRPLAAAPVISPGLHYFIGDLESDTMADCSCGPGARGRYFRRVPGYENGKICVGVHWGPGKNKGPLELEPLTARSRTTRTGESQGGTQHYIKRCAVTAI